MNFPFFLDKSTPTKLFQCPKCKHKSLKRYWNDNQKEYLPDIIGRCNRESNCGYHFTPKQYFEDKQIQYSPQNYCGVIEPIVVPELTFIDRNLVDKSVSRNAPNHFIAYLNALFREEITIKLVEQFKIGTSIHWEGACVFWQIDNNEKVRTGKVMLYDAHSGKRIKKPFNHIHWVHSLAKFQDFHLKQCLFGLHQIRDNLEKTIGIVESEKTAILLTAIYPKITWLASGGMNLSLESFEPLESRKIMLYPDAGIDNGNGTPFEKWTDKAENLALKGFDITVSNIIENVATPEQRTAGYDLADYLIKTDSSGLALNENDYPFFWDST